MKRMLCGLCVAALVAGVGCRRKEPLAAMIDVPAMRGPDCKAIVLKALSSVPGIEHDTIEADLTRRRVVLTYDSMIVALKNIEYAIADAGFQANDIPPDPKAMARLPAACREPVDAADAEPSPPDPDESAD